MISFCFLSPTRAIHDRVRSKNSPRFQHPKPVWHCAAVKHVALQPKLFNFPLIKDVAESRGEAAKPSGFADVWRVSARMEFL
jgi:hypothetical protein